MATTFFNEADEVEVPEWVTDLKSFRRWARSPKFPERGRLSHLKGNLWVDLTMETDLHNQIKSVITAILFALVTSARLGRFFTDGMRLTNAAVGLSVEPDAMFALWETLRSGRAVRRRRERSLEVEGSVDMALEVISRFSVLKDTRVLRELYWEAEIPEYWLVDARPDPATFTLLRRAARGYVAARPTDGWVKSNVFGRSFRLVRGVDPLGDPEYTLEVR